MNQREQLAHIRSLARKQGRYAPDAFLFVSEAIQQTVVWVRDGVLQPNDTGQTRGETGDFHVSGQELLAGIRKLARDRWGPMAKTVLNCWGVQATEDFGEIVFTMVEDEEMQWKKRECDSREDFARGFDFATAFEDMD